MTPKTTWAAGAAMTVLAAGAGASCNLVLGLDAYYDCPEDPKCIPDAGSGGSMTVSTASTTTSPGGSGGTSATSGSAGSGGTAPELCTMNGVRDGKETDVDCGGGLCPPCGDGKGCITGSDCNGHVCANGTCHTPACDDGVKNGDETDVDCGGGCGATCKAGKACALDGDCKGGTCTGGTCAVTCTDGDKNGAETGTDCGGPACPICPNGEGCAANGDCSSGVCATGVCKDYFVWAKAWGDSDPMHFSGAQAISATAAGDVVFSGTFQETQDFGGGAVTSAGLGDLVVAKLDATGAHVWSRHYGNANRTVAQALAVDNMGKVAIGGNFRGSLTMGSYTIAGNSGGLLGDIYVAKLDALGLPQWAIAGTANGGGLMRDIATDSSGSIISTGSFTGNFTLDGSDAVSAGATDAFLVKLGANGVLSWTKRLGDAGSQSGMSVAVDTSDNVIFTAVSSSALNLGGGNLGHAGGTDMYLAKYTSGGVHVWSKRYGDSADQGSVRVRVDSNDNIIAIGTFQGTIDFGGGPLTAIGSGSLFVTKLKPNGLHLWSKQFDGDVSALALAVDAAGNISLAGSLSGAIDFGGGPLVSMGGGTTGGDALVVKLDSNGNHLWSRRFGDSSSQTVFGIASGSAGALFVDGTFLGTLDFGGGTPLNASGGGSMFVAKLLMP